MKTRKDVSRTEVLRHFTSRAAKYDRSSNWCTDRTLIEKMINLLSPRHGDKVLDLACGTGLVSGIIKSKVDLLVGVDLTPAMFIQGQQHSKFMIQAMAEYLPLKNQFFDICLERQGIQFMDAPAALHEVARVTKPGGKICLTQLCAYGNSDMEEYFEILRLRNPARRNFFLKEDLAHLLREAGCDDIALHEHITIEDVDAWANNGAIDRANREAIRELYRSASEGFKRYHAVNYSTDGRIIDNMLFCIAIGVIPGAEYR